jgi:hypothetical protein
MKTRLRACLIAGVAVLGLVGAGAVALTSLAKETPVPAPNVAVSAISTGELASASELRLFFGHMSVGKNVLSGMRGVYETRGVAPPDIIEIERGGPAPQLAGDGGVLVHSLIGTNRDPEGKLANFDAALRGGLARQVNVAMVKFCYIDIRWDTDVEALFGRYKTTLDALERDYPDVTFVHVTAPLTTGPSGIKNHIKVLIGRDDNAARERFNALMRATYSSDRLFDLAAVESTAPDGTTSASLYAGYSSDSAHLNASGSSVAAVELLRLLARTDRP